MKKKTATIDEFGRIKESEGKEWKMGWEGGVRAHKLSNTCGPVRAQGKHHLVLIRHRLPSCYIKTKDSKTNQKYHIK